MRNLTPQEFEAKFPKLRAGNYQRISDASARYNCMAFVNGDTRHWWQAGVYGGRYHWPQTIRQQDTLESWVELFEKHGYEPTGSRVNEAGFEKIAIYVDLIDMLPSHVAKSDGRVWKSKLGKGQDIEDSSLELLEGNDQDEYGIVERILKRPLPK